MRSLLAWNSCMSDNTALFCLSVCIIIDVIIDILPSDRCALAVHLQFAKQFAARGNQVVATVRQLGAGKSLQDVLGGDVTIMQLDVADPSSVKAFAEEAKAALDHIDVLINNAGAAFISIRLWNTEGS